MKKKSTLVLAVLFVLSAMAISAPGVVSAHCDGMDGPVIVMAQKALETGNVTPVLIWVPKKDEAEVKKAFQDTLEVRKLSPKAKEIADMHFFETLVRIHRASEGEPFTGVKPAGRDLGPAIPAADKSIATGKLEPVGKLITGKIHEGLHARFEAVMAKKNFKPEDTQAGREYVEAYVKYLHYVEKLYEMAAMPATGHAHGTPGADAHKH